MINTSKYAKYSFTIIVFALFFMSCKQQNNVIKRRFSDTSVIFERDIPTYKYRDSTGKGDTDYAFRYITQEAQELNLSSIENGFNGLEIRVWLGHSMAIKKNVLILKKINGNWSGQILTYTYGHDENNGMAFIKAKHLNEVTPKSGWKNLMQKITDFQILTLPNGQDIKNYNSCGGADGIAYFFEIATLEKYRLYYYCNPDENINQFWQVKNVVEFTDMLENEFDFKYTR